MTAGAAKVRWMPRIRLRVAAASLTAFRRWLATVVVALTPASPAPVFTSSGRNRSGFFSITDAVATRNDSTSGVRLTCMPCPLRKS